LLEREPGAVAALDVERVAQPLASGAIRRS
jgi:hypothetical protein